MRYLIVFLLVINLFALQDSDHDGIVDDYDKCPHTKKGDLVDSDGCSLFGDDSMKSDEKDSDLETNSDELIDQNDTTKQNKNNLDEADKLLFEILNDNGDDVDENLTTNINDDDFITKDYNLYFKRGKYKLDEESSMKLEEIADYLKQHKNLKVQIVGYTDNIGKKSDNKILSIKRAKFVYDKLIKMGIDKNRMSYEGFGEEFPLYPNDTPEHRALNRRVEIRFIQ